MPSFDCKLQRNGFYTGWSSVVGASDGYLACDDSAGSSHDSDTTYIVLPKLAGVSGIVSFGAFDMVEHVVPTSVTLRVAAKTQTGSPVVEVGFSRNGSIQVSGSTFSTTGSYSLFTVSFNTNPFSGPWAEGDLQTLEPLIKMQAAILANARVTLVSATVNYNQAIDQYPPDPLCGVIGG